MQFKATCSHREITYLQLGSPALPPAGQPLYMRVCPTMWCVWLVWLCDRVLAYADNRRTILILIITLRYYCC